MYFCSNLLHVFTVLRCEMVIAIRDFDALVHALILVVFRVHWVAMPIRPFCERCVPGTVKYAKRTVPAQHLYQAERPDPIKQVGICTSQAAFAPRRPRTRMIVPSDVAALAEHPAVCF